MSRSVRTWPSRLVSFFSIPLFPSWLSRFDGVGMLRVLGLSLSISLLWAWHYQMWTREAWTVPLDYSGDSHEILTRIKAAAEGDTWPLLPQILTRLGAPWGAHWNGYPTPDKFLVLGLGGLTRLWGLAITANLALLLATVSSGLAFYGVARRFKAQWEWAFAGALLFAFTYSVFHRGLAHLLLLFTWTVPIGLLCCWFIGRKTPLVWRSRETWICLGIAASLGASNPYNLFFWCQLICWAIVAQFFGARHKVNLQIGAACIAVAGAGFLVVHAEFWLYTASGGLPLLARNYGGTEMYALKAVEMFVPPSSHRWDWMAFFGNRYARWSDWRGEPFLPYLGMVGIAGFIWLCVDSVRRVLRGKAPSGWALQTSWILSYGALGGITNILALFLGFQIFRATNRISVFVGCIALLFLMVRLSGITRQMSPAWRWVLALAVAAIGALDQIPRQFPAERHGLMAARVKADEVFGKALEASLPTGSMVFQLPVLGFPEVVTPYRLVDYELFRPYLHTTSLRFSYGGAKFRSRSRWQRDLEVLPVPQMVERLQRYGFAAIYLNRRAYEDGGAAILGSLAHLGYTRVLDGGASEQVAIYLNPSSKPELPLVSTLTPGEGWYSSTEGSASSQVRWSFGPSTLMYFNPYDRPLSIDLQFRMSGAGTRTVEVRFKGKTVGQAHLGDEPSDLPKITVVLEPGVNRFDVRSPEPALRLNQGRSQLRSIGLHDVTVTVPPRGPGA